MLGSLRARVTVAFVLGAVVVVAASSMVLYRALVGQLSEALDADLTARGDDIVAAVRAGGTQALQTDPLAQLYDSSGRLLASSPSLSGRGPRLLPPDRVAEITVPVATTTLSPVGPDGRQVTVRLLSQRVEPGGAVVTVGVSTHRRLPVVPGDDEIARLARTLDAMQTRLWAAFDRERAFVDDASHELRTPIAVLRGELELALSAAGDPQEVRRSLRSALAEAQRLAGLAEGLLVMARAQAGILVTRREMVDLLDLARAQGRRLAPGPRLRIEVSGDPVVVPADRVLLQQVLANLAVNSAAAGATVLGIALSRQPGVVVAQVADDGPGFPAGILPHVFERFVRGDRRTPATTGAGLGLPIVKAVVDAHGGTVVAANGGPYGGAVVTLRLPES
jgi:signal transduction histidine kinase